jgi:hypothetical protein
MLLRQLKREEKAMKARILESVAARAANGWQRAGSKFDFQVFAMPGGSVMAPALWVYSMMSSALKRSPPHSIDTPSANAQSGDAPGATDVPSAARTPTAARAPGAVQSALSCPWPRAHCA